MSEFLHRVIRRARTIAAHRYEQWLETRFERRYGIDTSGTCDDLEALGVTGEALAHAHGYEPVQIPVFRRIVRACGIEPRAYAMVDFGCGKGRALVLGAEAGFKRLIGVELAPALYEVACRNIDALNRRRRPAPRIELHLGNAADLAIPEEDALLFFYNPFGEAVMQKVARNIERSLLSRPRKLIVAYRNPVHSPVLDEMTCLERVTRNRTFALYRAPPERAADH
jgi:SAM-dependent methyltransferase